MFNITINDSLGYTVIRECKTLKEAKTALKETAMLLIDEWSAEEDEDGTTATFNIQWYASNMGFSYSVKYSDGWHEESEYLIERY